MSSCCREGSSDEVLYFDLTFVNGCLSFIGGALQIEVHLQRLFSKNYRISTKSIGYMYFERSDEVSGDVDSQLIAVVGPDIIAILSRARVI